MLASRQECMTISDYIEELPKSNHIDYVTISPFIIGLFTQNVCLLATFLEMVRGRSTSHQHLSLFCTSQETLWHSKRDFDRWELLVGARTI
jgi:hypothetical protein